MSLKKNLFLIYLVYFSRAAVYLLLLPLLIRRLDEGWGQVATVLSFIMLATTAMEFGFGVSATKSVARNRDSIEFLSQIVRSVILVQLVLFLIISLVGLPLVYFPVIQHGDYFFYVLLIVLFQGLSPLWFLRGVEDMVLISASEVASKFLVLILVFFFVEGADDIGRVYVIYLVGALIPVLASYHYIYKRYLSGASSSITVFTVLNQIKEGSVFFGVRLSAMFVSVGGSLMLGAAGHIKLAGSFAIAERILSGVRRVLMPAWDVLFPKVISLLAKDEKEAQRFRKKVTHAMIAFSLLTSLALLIFAPLLVQYFSGNKNENIILMVQIMSMGPFFVSVTNSLGLNFLVSVDRDSSFLFSFFSGFIIYFILNGFFIISGIAQNNLKLFAFSYDAALALNMMMVIYFVKGAAELRKSD